MQGRDALWSRLTENQKNLSIMKYKKPKILASGVAPNFVLHIIEPLPIQSLHGYLK